MRAACHCQREADEAAGRRAVRERFERGIERRREDGISCPNGLRYTFDQDDRAEQKASDACRRYVEHWKEMLAEDIGILFHGSVGTGKSFYASYIGNDLLEKRVPVAATNFPRLLNMLQGTQERQKLLDRLAMLPVTVTTNLTLEELEQPPSMQYARIYDRVLEMCPARLT